MPHKNELKRTGTPRRAKIFKSHKSWRVLCKLGFHVPVKMMVTDEVYEVYCQQCMKDLKPEDWDKVWKGCYD